MNIKQSPPHSFTAFNDAVHVELEQVIESSPPALRNILRYHMGWQDQHGHRRTGQSGKLIRPALCLLSCKAVNGDTAQVMPAAAALELIHNFSLIHDDIEDASDERHHRPAVWKVWGQPQAINAGDAMFTLAYIALLKLKVKGIADEKIAISTKMLSQACLELCEGQYLDLEYERRFDVTIKDYLAMAEKKTAALLAVSTSLGAYLGSEHGKVVDCLHLFGRDLGMAFQIRDDIAGIWGTEESTGKSASDIPQRKKTLPVVYGLRNSRGRARERLEKLYSQESIGSGDIAEVTRILEELGARDYAENLAKQYHCDALAQLEATGLDSSETAPLKEMASFLLERESQEG